MVVGVAATVAGVVAVVLVVDVVVDETCQGRRSETLSAATSLTDKHSPPYSDLQWFMYVYV